MLITLKAHYFITSYGDPRSRIGMRTFARPNVTFKQWPTQGCSQPRCSEPDLAMAKPDSRLVVSATTADA